MAKEYDCRCNNCGRSWFYNDADIRDIQSQAGAVKGRFFVGAINAVRGDSIGARWQGNRIEDIAASIQNLARCKCGSMEVSITATEVFNPFLDDPASPLYLDKDDIAAAPEGSKSKTVAGLLGIIFGAFGAHKFYLGYKKEGLIVLLISLVGSFLTLGASMTIMAVIGLIEGISYLTKSNGKFYNTYILNHKGWF